MHAEDSTELSGLGGAELAQRWLESEDPAVLEVLLERSKPIVARLAKDDGAAVDEADIGQEAALGILHALLTFSPEEELSFLAHMRRCIKSQLRRAGTGPQLATVEVAPDSLTDPDEPAEALERAEFAERLRDAVDDFSRDLSGLRLALLRERVVSDDPLTLVEVADRLGLSREAVRRAERGLVAQLRRHLSRRLADSLPTLLGTI